MPLTTNKDQQIKQRIAQRFGRAASHYANYSVLQRLTGDRLLTRAPFSHPGVVLDLGCGDGYYSRQLRAAGHKVVAMDLSAGMLNQAQCCQSADWYLRADLDQLPLRDGSVNQLWSNLALQWSADQVKAIRQLLALLTVQGQLRCTTLGDGSLPELVTAFRRLGHQAPTNQFIRFDWLAAQLQDTPMQFYLEPVRCHFHSALDAMWSLKGVGATYLAPNSALRPLNRHKLQLLEQYWPRDPLGYTVTYQVIYGVMN